jgi:hypothetical protein
VAVHDLDVDEPGRFELGVIVVAGEGAGDARGPGLVVSAELVRRVVVGDDVCYREAATGAQEAEALGEHRGLVG